MSFPIRTQSGSKVAQDISFSGIEVVIKHFGNWVLLLPNDDPLQTMQAGLYAFEPGFVLESQQPSEQVNHEVKT